MLRLVVQCRSKGYGGSARTGSVPKEKGSETVISIIFIYMYVSVTKIGQGHPKLLLVRRLYWTYQATKYEIII